jgi:hypothetical protein
MNPEGKPGNPAGHKNAAAETDNDSIDSLEKSLYSRNAPQVRAGRHLHLRPKNYDVKDDWDHPKDTFEDDFDDAPMMAGFSTGSTKGGFDAEHIFHGADVDDDDISTDDTTSTRGRYAKSHVSFFTKFLIASVIFFILCLGTGAYFVWKGADLISANNIDINLAGPVSVAGGSPANFTVQVSNKNNVALQVVNMTVDYPPGTADSNDPASPLKETQEILPNIVSGGIGQQNISAIFYGEANSQKTIQVTINYTVAGSNATFTKEKTFNVLISSSPLTITATSFTQITSGQSFEIDVTVKSNSPTTIDSLLLKAAYPFGFTFASATPRPVDTAHSVWAIGDLPAGGTAVIKIKGSLQGQDQQARVFNFSVGAAQVSTNTGGIGNTMAAQTIGTEYISGSDSVTIAKPFLSLDLALGGDDTDSQYIGAFDTPETGQITWFNNTTNTIINGEIDLNLSGTAFDKASVSPGQGFYDSGNSQIVWNQVTTPALASIGAGQSGTITFTITPRNLSSQSNPITNPELNLSLSAKGNQIAESNVPTEIDSTVNKNILISSNVALSGQVVRSTGPFANSGPIPPVAQQQTTYTVVWTVYNTSNTLDGVQVAAILPPYVKWIGAISPTTANINYNSTNGQVTWNIGNVSAYGGTNSGGVGSVGGGTGGASAPAQQVAFQLGVTPGVDLVGQTPSIIGNAVLVARDDFTGASLTNTVQALTTRFSTDPTYNEGDEIVVGK